MAYMTSLENRLQETEIALYTALRALHTQVGDASAVLATSDSWTSTHRRSKAEKLNEWKQSPLRTSQDLLVWFDQQHHSFESSTSVRQGEMHPKGAVDARMHTATAAQLNAAEVSEEQHSLARAQSPRYSGALIEQLRSCRPPTVPNTTMATHAAMWHENYF